MDFRNIFKKSASNGFLLKLFLIACVAISLGIPLISLPLFLVFLASTLFILTGPARPVSRKWILIPCLALLPLLLRMAAPLPVIEEGHNVALWPDDARGQAIYGQALPEPVLASLRTKFETAYPQDKRCPPQTSGCWQSYHMPGKVFAWSADGAWQSPHYSRRVSQFDYRDIITLRGGFINDTNLNWYAWSSDIPRSKMPYFVMLEWRENTEGGQFCWQGSIFRQRADSTEQLPPSGCQIISPEDRGTRIIGLSLKDDTLALKYSPPRMALAWQHIILALGCLSALAIAALSVRFSWKTHLPMGLFLLASGVMISITSPWFLNQSTMMQGGNDGLTHAGFGRSIAQAILDGDWTGALLGRESVYYFMPGLRYARAVERLLFGESYHLYLAALMLLPWAIFLLAKRITDTRMAACLVVFFLIGPFNIKNFNYAAYVFLAYGGFAETMGYTLFVGGLASLCKILDFKEKKHPGSDWMIPGLLLALSVWMRPNLAPSAGILILFLMGHLSFRRYWKQAFLAGLGFSPVLLMLVHNLAFGHAFVPLTAASAIPENLITPPARYLAALGEMLSGSHGPATTRIIDHLGVWLMGPLKPLAFVSVLAALAFPASSPMRWLGLAALPMHVVLFFYIPLGRYEMSAWLLSYLALAGILYHASIRTWGWAAARFPQKRAAPAGQGQA